MEGLQADGLRTVSECGSPLPLSPGTGRERTRRLVLHGVRESRAREDSRTPGRCRAGGGGGASVPYFAARSVGISATVMKPMNISSQLCSPQRTVLVASGLLALRLELSWLPLQKIQVPAGMRLGSFNR